jgi:hypothetical protein
MADSSEHLRVWQAQACLWFLRASALLVANIRIALHRPRPGSSSRRVRLRPPRPPRGSPSVSSVRLWPSVTLFQRFLQLPEHFSALSVSSSFRSPPSPSQSCTVTYILLCTTVRTPWMCAGSYTSSSCSCHCCMQVTHTHQAPSLHNTNSSRRGFSWSSSPFSSAAPRHCLSA